MSTHAAKKGEKRITYGAQKMLWVGWGEKEESRYRTIGNREEGGWGGHT